MSALSNDDFPTYESLEMASSKTDTEWAHRDPRSSSQQSLVPESEQNERRKLLLIYVHGFMVDLDLLHGQIHADKHQG